MLSSLDSIYLSLLSVLVWVFRVPLLLRADKDESVRSRAIESGAGELLSRRIIKSNAVHCLNSKAAPVLSAEGNSHIKHIPVRSG